MTPGERALLRIHAALRSGAGPVEALGAAAPAQDPAVAALAARAALGRPLGELADSAEARDAGLRGLVQALAVAERAGRGATTGVEQALEAIRSRRALERLLTVKTAQARGTARALTALPVVGWLVMVAADGAARAFSRTPVGLALLALAAALALAAHRVSQRIVARTQRAPWHTDPLWPETPDVDLRRGVLIGLPILAAGLVVGTPATGVVLGAAAGVAAARGRPPVGPDLSDGGTAEVCELLALGLDGGLAPPEAVGLVADLGPRAARAELRTAHRRLAAGWSAQRAFADTALDGLGDVLDASMTWGAPAAPALRGLADDLRADRRAAAEEAAERVQLALVVPTTTLTLPAFALATVPPVVWAGLRGWSVG